MAYEVAVVDFESASACDIRKAGAEVYWEHPTTFAHCLAWAFDDLPTQLWSTADPRDMLDDLFAFISRGGRVVGHNVGFEWCGFQRLHTDKGWPRLRFDQCDDTMARARALALPADLERCSEAMRLPITKDTDGHRSMLKLARPRRREPLEFWTPETAPEDFAKLYAYCKTDVDVERQLLKRLPPLSAKERALWILDHTINQRGVMLDVENINLAAALVEEEGAALNAKVALLTGGEAPTARSQKKMLSWLQNAGLPELTSLAKGGIAEALKLDDLPKPVKAALALRKESAKASTAKLTAMLAGVCADWRARGLLAFHAATTGRWGGRRIQTQNLPRPAKHFKAKDAETVIGWLSKPNARALIRSWYGSVMDAVSWSLRAFIVARAGHRFICADYSNIEGRVIAWLAGEAWKLAAFLAFDTFKLDANGQRIPDPKDPGEFLREGPDLYKLAASKSFGISIELIDDYMRQIGKTQELGLGFGGSVGALVNMCKAYGADPEQIAAAVKAAVAPDVWERAATRLPKETSKRRLGLAAETWIGLRVVVDLWRDAHPEIRSFWYQLEEAAIEAVKSPGTITRAGAYIRFRVMGDFLLMRLPSGRCLSYAYPEMRPCPTMAHDELLDELRAEFERLNALPMTADLLEVSGPLLRRIGELEGNPETEMRLTFWGLDSVTNQWCRQRASSVQFAENATQAVARDCLAEALPRCEAAGYPVVMHVHDEILCEVPEGRGSVLGLCAVMCDLEAWAHGLPVAAAGWEGLRYRK